MTRVGLHRHKKLLYVSAFQSRDSKKQCLLLRAINTTHFITDISKTLRLEISISAPYLGVIDSIVRPEIVYTV
jgi:hypothetical protein